MHSAIMGGSTCERVINCPGSVRLSEKYPRQKASPAALRGTALHEVMEKLLKDELHIPDVVGYTTKTGYRITQELFDAKVAPAYNAITAFIDNHCVDTLWVEPLVRFAQRPDVFGSIDVLGLTAHNEMVVLDYKFGDGLRVSPKDNYQLLFYAAAAYQDPVLAEVFENADRLIVGIIQPLESGADALRTHTYTEKPKALLLQFTARIFGAIACIDTPEPILAEGKWCRWCQAAPTCPIKRGMAKYPERLRLNEKEDLEDALNLVPKLKEWIGQVEKAALDQMTKGVMFHRFKIVDKRPSRKWTSETKVCDFIRKFPDIKLSEVTKTTLKTPLQVEALCIKRGVNFDYFSDFVTKESSGVTVVPIDDKRPESPIATIARLQVASDS